MTQNRVRPVESLLSNRIKLNQVNDSNAKTSSSHVQTTNLKRQQSVDYDRRRQQSQRPPDSSTTSQPNRRSIRINIMPTNSQRSSQETQSRGIKIDSHKRS